MSKKLEAHFKALKHVMGADDEKECRKCEDNKPKSEFSPDRRNKDGLHSY